MNFQVIEDEGWEIYEPGTRYSIDGWLRPEAVDSKLCWWIEAVRLPGLVSQGDTIEEAYNNFREAAAGVIKSYKEQGIPIPFLPYQIPSKTLYEAKWLINVTVDLTKE